MRYLPKLRNWMFTFIFSAFLICLGWLVLLSLSRINDIFVFMRIRRHCGVHVIATIIDVVIRTCLITRIAWSSWVYSRFFFTVVNQSLSLISLNIFMLLWCHCASFGHLCTMFLLQFLLLMLLLLLLLLLPIQYRIK